MGVSSYRNAAQHNDEHNPATTVAISRIFFVVVSNLFAKIQHSGHSAYYGATPEWAKNYSEEKTVVYKDLAKLVARKLQRGISMSLPSIKRVFVADLRARIQEIDDIIDELPVTGSKEINHMLRMYEYEQSEEYKALNANIYDAKYRMESESVNYHDSGKLNSVVRSQDEVLRNKYKAKVTYQTYQKIKSCYKSILEEKDLQATLRAYERFNKPLESLEFLFIHAINQWYEWQDLQVDIARGK